MEPLSRVKKNLELRQEVENSREDELTSSVLAPYADRLNRINPQLSSIESGPKDPDYNPLHSRDEKERSPLASAGEDPAFHHDLLDEFIDEVKNYNVKKGYSSSEDTKQNILTKVAKPTEFRVEEESRADDQMTQEIKKVISHDFEPEYLEPVDPFPLQSRPDVYEETAKIKIKLDSVDQELLEMSRSVNSSSRVLNVIAFVLVVVLLVMLCFAFYWIYSVQGF